MQYGNCLIYVIAQWLRHGGYVVVRQSRVGWWPHFMWSADLLVFSNFVPDIPAHTRLAPPLLFRGRVVVVRVPEDR